LPRAEAALKILKTLAWFGLTAACALFFYERYWRWRDCFNELGRCYDTYKGVMTEAAGPIWGTLTLIFGLVALRSLWRLLKQRNASEAP
jgi:hypothetical protein